VVMTETSQRFTRFSRYVTAKVTWVLVFAVFLTIIGTWLTLKLPLQTDISELLPDNYVSVRTLRRLYDEIGGFASLRILLEGPDLEALKEYARRLEPALMKSPRVKLVDYKKDVEFYRRNALLYLPLSDLERLYERIEERYEQESLKYNPMYAELDEEDSGERVPLTFEDIEKKYRVTDDKIYYINPEHTILVMNVYPVGKKSDVAFARGFYEEIQQIVRQTPPPVTHPPIKVEYGGNFKNKIDEYLVIISDVRSSIASGLFLVALLIVLYFRRLMAVVIIGIPLAMSLSWTFGLTRLVIGRLNTMTVFLFVVLFGLGIDYGIHLFARYLEFRRKGVSIQDALPKAILSTGRALVTSTMTTSAAFYTLMIADFRGFKEFGFIAGSAILLSLLATLTVLPGFIYIHEKWRPFVPRTSPEKRLPSVSPRVHLTRWVLLISVVLTVIALFMAPRVQLEYDFTNLRSNIPASIKVKQKLSTIFKESNSPAVVLVDHPKELREIEKVINDKIHHDPTPTIDKFRSIESMLPRDQDRKLELIRKIRARLQDPRLKNLKPEEKKTVRTLLDLTQVHRLTPDDLPPEVVRLFTDRKGRVGRFAYIFPSVQLRDGRNAIAFAEDVKNIVTPSGRVYHAANSAVVSADMLTLMLVEGKRAAIFTFLAVALLVYLDFRRPLHAVLVLTPLFISVLWLVGLMTLLGIKFNFYNLVVIPSILGMGIDSGVHIFHRYLEEGPGSIPYVLRHTGVAVFVCTLTTMVGFSGLLLAHHPGLNSIGKLAVLGLSFTLLASLVAFPALLHFMEIKRPGLSDRLFSRAASGDDKHLISGIKPDRISEHR